ncbi:UDP-N-acetylmuramoyl-L-alanine--D-glutamate ligase [Piscinibacter terrae]|uniref:UDP-N-acetylmuramoylalanine--D-glutamate ligase n=1 Tax=Piscinibacter terrae TaxID=2496871 RepID=A0A3N7HHK7_9BURK|nr:UDP-N-acetylmuramoyl-L-alanine--D-glutamate ligase [Albitalea terrae]RQP21534.1 UDP-N-acetylmuramoyl-L-alanine--D-glutamate ligase [Albitalea terrae]
MKHLKDITVLVLGLGESGLAMARWSARCGATVRVWDSREIPPHAAALAQHVPGAKLYTGVLPDEAIDGVRLVLKSPGLAPTDERIAPAMAKAADAGALVQGELELFARALDDLKAERQYAPKVLAITGTNGKTTTTAMTALFVSRAGKRVAMAGNIGPTMLQTLSDALDLEPVPEAAVESAAESHADGPVEAPAEGVSIATEEDSGTVTVSEEGVPVVLDDAGEEPSIEAAPAPMEGQEAAVTSVTADEPPAEHAVSSAADALEGMDGPPPHLIPPPPPGPVFEHLPEVWVLELSSFQLDEAKGFEPSAGTVLNITQDHLDWHGNMAAYTGAKARIFGKNAVMVINRDDPAVEALVPRPPEPPAAGSKKVKAPKFVPRDVVRFGLDAPTHPGDFGLMVENGMAWLVRAMEADETIKKPKRGAAAEEEDLIIQRLMPADALRVRGRHNAANALAALALATAVGCPLAPMLHGLREYGGEPHRVEYVATVNGVEAYDDSKGTNVGATVAALNGLGMDKSPAKLVVILGGDGKGQDFAPLADPVAKHARAVATIGRDAQAVEDAIASCGVPIQRHETLEAAVAWCFTRAHAGDAVLLSPACASLDMFRNYAHRAEVFVNEVRALAAEHGDMSA